MGWPLSATKIAFALSAPVTAAVKPTRRTTARIATPTRAPALDPKL
jgi:hypothetical protein